MGLSDECFLRHFNCRGDRFAEKAKRNTEEVNALRSLTL